VGGAPTDPPPSSLADPVPSSPLTTNDPSSPPPLTLASLSPLPLPLPPLDPMRTPELLPELPPPLLVAVGALPSIPRGDSLFCVPLPTAQSTERRATSAAPGNRYCLRIGGARQQCQCHC
jgi:hypothetical protein